MIFSTIKSRNKKNDNSYYRGFTIIELVVTLFIIITITILSVPAYTSFQNRAELDNVFLNVLSAVREAQVYGLGSREGTAGDFDLAYGVSFNMGWRSTAVLFTDIDGNGAYNGDETCGDPECFRKIDFIPGYEVSRLCVRQRGNPIDYCSLTYLSDLNITFKRDNPSASTDPNLGLDIEGGLVTIQGPTGEKKSLFVASTGELSSE